MGKLLVTKRLTKEVHDYLLIKILKVQFADLYNSRLKFCPFESTPLRVMGNSVISNTVVDFNGESKVFNSFNNERSFTDINSVRDIETFWVENPPYALEVVAISIVMRLPLSGEGEISTRSNLGTASVT